MLMDKNLLFSDAQNLAQSAGTYLSDKSIDLGVAGTDVNGGAPIIDPGRSIVQLVAQVVTAFTSGGSATVQAQLVMADDAALSSNLVVLESTAVIAVATLVAGYRFRFGSLPPGVTKRYVGLQYVIGTATTTAGNVTAGLVMDASSWNI